MSDDKKTLATAANIQPWDLNLIFSVLADPVRRGTILSLARNGPQTAAALLPAGLSARGVMVRLNRVVKSLTNLREAGLVVVIPNPTDGRKQLYSLAPGISVTKTETGCHLDLGICLFRL